MVCDALSLQTANGLLATANRPTLRKCIPFKAFKGPVRAKCLSSSSNHAAEASGPPRLQEGCLAEADALQLGRRAVLTALSSSVLGSAVSPALAGGQLTAYADERDHFQLSVPSDWVAAEGAAQGNKGFTGPSGSRRALAWFPESGTSTNVTVLVTNVGADYTGLGSFGSAETFGQNLISSLDRSFMLRSGFNRPKSVQVARLLDAKARSNMYFLEYTVQKEDENEPRHFLSAVSLGFNGRYNRFYTLNAQCPESELPTYKGTLESIVNSFKPPAPVV